MKVSTRIASVGLLIVIGLFVSCIIVSRIPYVEDHAASTYAKFVDEVGETDIPESAKNIRHVCASVGMGGRAHIGRFEAPLEDCIAFGIAEFKSYDFDDVTPDNLPFTKPSEAPHVPDLSGYGIRNLDWFDVENIEHAITLERDHSHRPFVWIDTQRNILYFYWTD